ncbi:MAG: DUF6377 domain-containing protein [Odoribacter sp.]|nr:DUF6377 domain-containing protein [Odoribacter sp.]
MYKSLIFILLVAATIFPADAALEITGDIAHRSLVELDDSLAKRQHFIDRRQSLINRLIDSMNHREPDEHLLFDIANHYSGFNNDSALHYFSLGYHSEQVKDRLPFALGTAVLLPLSGFFSPAIEIYDSIDVIGLDNNRLATYYDSGRQMYSYMAAFSAGEDQLHSQYNSKALELQRRLLDVLPKESMEYKFNLGEYYFLTGQNGKSRALLEYVMENTPVTSPLRARAAHHLSSMANDHGDENAYTYYLAQSALADLSAATREVASLQELGNHLYSKGDVDRSYYYLTEALSNAVECGAPLRMIESSRSLPIIEHAYNEQLNSKRHTIYMILAILIVVVIVLVITMIVLNHKMHRLRVLEATLRQANHIKEVYISQFLNLCSIYMDKLNQFCKIANRKITAGKVDDLYRLTKSGKFVEEQSKDFYEVFDNAFLHLYPNFVEQVNALLRPDSRIILKEGEQLNTDLRILAFMRLGIEESPRIAQVLNYSLNTIYAYRNRTKARAINRDTFEEEIMKIKSM